MTSTDKRVTRLTRYPYRASLSGVHKGEGRKLAVTIAPGDMLELREHGRRITYEISIAEVFRLCVTQGRTKE